MLLCSVFALVTLPVAAQAQSSAEEDVGSAEEAGEAQLKAAWQQVEAGEWDQAIESARTVRRLIPAEHAALLVWAIAYEGKAMLRKAQSYLLTYRELTQHRDSHPAAEKLQTRLERALGQPIGSTSWGAKEPISEKVEVSETVVSMRRASGAFGDGYVQVGFLAGVRSFAQRSCPSGGGICSGDDETRPGLWAYDASAFGGGLSVRAEYFFGHSFVGARLRFDVVPNQPVDHHGIDRPQSTDANVRLDAHVVARIPLSRGRVGVQLMADVAYGMRSFDVIGNVSSTEATEWAFVANQLGGGLGLRVEPLRRLGIEARGGAAVLLKPGGGLTETEVEVAVVLQPLPSLVVRIAGDFRRSTWIFARDGAQTEVRDLVAGVWAGVGLAF
jgi:hypothetical protein